MMMAASSREEMREVQETELWQMKPCGPARLIVTSISLGLGGPRQDGVNFAHQRQKVSQLTRQTEQSITYSFLFLISCCRDFLFDPSFGSPQLVYPVPSSPSAAYVRYVSRPLSRSLMTQILA
jgi:hypothetical protein